MPEVSTAINQSGSINGSFAEITATLILEELKSIRKDMKHELRHLSRTFENYMKWQIERENYSASEGSLCGEEFSKFCGNLNDDAIPRNICKMSSSLEAGEESNYFNETGLQRYSTSDGQEDVEFINNEANEEAVVKDKCLESTDVATFPQFYLEKGSYRQDSSMLYGNNLDSQDCLEKIPQSVNQSELLTSRSNYGICGGTGGASRDNLAGNQDDNILIKPDNPADVMRGNFQIDLAPPQRLTLNQDLVQQQFSMLLEKETNSFSSSLLHKNGKVKKRHRKSPCLNGKRIGSFEERSIPHLHQHKAIESSEKNPSVGTNMAESKPFICKVCGKSFARNGTLNTHRLVHEEPMAHGCKYCPRRFTYKHNLKVHMRTHTGEMPYSCQFCGKKFNQSGSLKSHLRIHTGEKPYECEQCRKTFSQQSALKKHMSIHAVKPIDVSEGGMQKVCVS